MTLDGSYKAVIDVTGERGLRAQCGVNGCGVQVQFGFIREASLHSRVDVS